MLSQGHTSCLMASYLLTVSQAYTEPCQTSSAKIVSTTQKVKSPIKDFFSKCDQIRSFLPIWCSVAAESR